MGEKVFLLRDADVSGKKLLWDAGLEVVVARAPEKAHGSRRCSGSGPRPFLPGLTG